MRAYLDPTLYAFTVEEWRDYAFVSRLDDLLASLQKFSEWEKLVDLLYKIFRFRGSEESLNAVYNLNPVLNDPERPLFYVQQFQNSILPEILRRTDYCPSESCLQECVGSCTPPSVAEAASDRIKAFASDLAVCAGCGDQSIACLLTHGNAEGGLADNDFFSLEIDLPDDALAVASPVDVFPWNSSEHSDERLSLALEARIAQLRIIDPTWSSFSLSPLVVATEFWTRLRREDFGAAERLYKERIVDVLVQIAANRDVDLHQHRMVSEHYVVAGARRGKWNGYVFQSGPTAEDRRCSRIYFARLPQGAYIAEYEPDAH